MPIKLRTRLFLTISLVLAATIAASALLSRRATLVEIREIVAKTEPRVPDAVVSAVQGHVREHGREGLASFLAKAVAGSDRALVVLDPAGRHVLASSHDAFAGGRVLRRAQDGALAMEMTTGDSVAVVELRGVRRTPLVDAAGRPFGVLCGVPAPPSRERAERRRVVPPWVMTTAMTAVVGLLVTFIVSRRVLKPVTALTQAVQRLESGDLGARVSGSKGGDELATLTRAFNQMAERLEATEHLRRQLVTDVAHELRSPVTNLRCHLEAVQDGLMPLNRTTIDGLHEQIVYLSRLIGDLQDLSLADSGHLTMEAGVVDVGEVARRAAAAFAPTPGAQITVTAGAEPALVRGDEARLEQVFRNLLSNARRHTSAAGGIQLQVERANGSVRAHVRDSGDGIAPEHLSHVFDRFYRADGSRSRATGGAGLGLAIARQLVVSHGGRLTVESEGPGRGATFTIDLPAERETG